MNNDKELFKDTAWYYSRYRKGYPKPFFDYLIKTFKLDNNSRILDLGTGTGQIAIPLASIVGEVVAIDPEIEMIKEGKRVANSMNIKNIKWMQLRAEDTSNNFGMFDVVTIGAAFHWMDREVVLKKVYDITKNKGGVIIVSEINNNENWKVVRKNVIEKYLGKKRRAGKSFYEKGDDKFEDRLMYSPFGNCEVWNYYFDRLWKLDEVINFLYSTSFSSKNLFGNNLKNFERELKSELLKIEPTGIFKEKVWLQALISRKLS